MRLRISHFNAFIVEFFVWLALDIRLRHPAVEIKDIERKTTQWIRSDFNVYWVNLIVNQDNVFQRETKKKSLCYLFSSCSLMLRFGHCQRCETQKGQIVPWTDLFVCRTAWLYFGHISNHAMLIFSLWLVLLAKGFSFYPEKVSSCSSGMEGDYTSQTFYSYSGWWFTPWL